MIDEDGEPLGEVVSFELLGPGEKRLWHAVLIQALTDATNDRAGVDQHTARRWLNDGNWQFRMVCGLAGLDPDWVRGKWKRMNNSGKVRGVWRRM